MFRISIFIVLSIFALRSDCPAAEYVRGEVLVKFRHSAGTAAINALHSHVGSARTKDFHPVRIQQVKLPDDMSVEEAVDLYNQDPDVEYAEPNYIVHATAFPDDPSFAELWGLHNTGQAVQGTAGTPDADIDAPEAWDLTTGSAAVVIAVIDSGVAYNHPDFYDPSDPGNNNIWINNAESGPSCMDNDDDNGDGINDDCDECANGIDDDGNGYIDDCRGWDFIGDDNDPSDFNNGVGHGTHVAGTIAAFGNNGTAMTGVMWRASIMPIRFLGINGSGSISDALSAILYAKTMGADVINNSWAGEEFSRALKDAIDVSGAVVVCAAGNEGTDNDILPQYPSSYDSPNIISVAATDSSDGLSRFSNYGPTSVDIAAPGVNIYSTVPLYSNGSAVAIYPLSGAENFDGAAGALPTSGNLLGWRRGGDHSAWAITADTGRSGRGDNTLEDSPQGTYVNNTHSWAGYMTRITSEKDNLYTLTFQWKGELEQDFDYLDINSSPDEVNWERIDSRTGNTAGRFISDSTTALTETAELYSHFYFGFGLSSDGSNVYDGVYIDNVALSRTPLILTGYSYDYIQGTSMAAPHVAGVAGLIKSLNPGLTSREIIDALIISAEAKISLKDKVLTGGRLNARQALAYSLAPYAPSGLTVIPLSGSTINLQWQDNTTTEEGFSIERKAGEDSTFSEIASVNADTISYHDGGLVPATTYVYRIRVFGPSLGDYAYSAEARAITPLASADNDRGRCFIATAAYGSAIHPHVEALRMFRDRYLLPTSIGRNFMALYYRYSPPVAHIISNSEGLRTLVRIMLIPLVMGIAFPYASSGVFIVLLSLFIVFSTNRRRAPRRG